MTMTPEILYARIIASAVSAYAGKSYDVESAKQMAHALTTECVNECIRMGLVQPSDKFPLVASPAQVQPQAAPQQVVPAQQLPPVPGQMLAPPQPVTPSDQPWYPPHLAYLHQPAAPAAAPGASVPVAVPQVAVASGAGQVAVAAQPYDVAGTKIVPPAGNTFQPPAQAGVMSQVTQLPTPQAHSALGTGGVIAQPQVRPNGQDTIVAPGTQTVVQQVGGAGTVFVPERIVR